MAPVLVRVVGPTLSRALTTALAELGVDASGKVSRSTPRVALVTRARVVADEAHGPSWLWLPSERASPEAERRAVLAGAYDVIATSDADAVSRIAARARELTATEREDPLPGPSGFVAESEVARRTLAAVARAARTSMPVLLTGETGTGKELAARLLHAWSARHARRFVPINCAGIPNDLIEAELFGYARGAFSGAVRQYDGQLVAATGGTVLLDEIDDTPPTLQTKLLRVLEDRVVSRLGQNEWHEVDFRIVAASNRDLEALIEAGAFGKDLFERLAIVRVDLPPLRERTADVPALAQHFVERYYAEEPGVPPERRVSEVAASAVAALVAYPWPGNVRELRNVVYETLVGKRAGDVILLSDLPGRILRKHDAAPPIAEVVDRSALRRRLDAGALNLRREIEALERAALEEALSRTGGHAARAARLLGEVGRGAARDPGGTVRAMMRRLGITTR